ncbi:MAG: C39 family peptidase, partial [Planctomycetota bacterium]
MRTRLLATLGVIAAALFYFQVHAFTAPPPSAPRAMLLEGVPHVRQKPDFCGEACAEMWLRKLGQRHTQDDVYNFADLDPSKGRGCYAPELNRALRRIGFATGDVWTKVPAEPKALRGPWAELLADLAKGVPSIVCTRYDASPDTTEHFRLVLGWDEATDEVVYHEPAEDAGAYRRMKRGDFLSLWPLKDSEDRWTVIRMRLEGKRFAAPRSP